MYAHRMRWGHIETYIHMTRRAVISRIDIHGGATAEPHRGRCTPVMINQTREMHRGIVGWTCMPAPVGRRKTNPYLRT